MFLPIFVALLCHYFVLCGSWKNHLRVFNLYCLADVYCQCGIWKATMMNGRCILPIVADVIATVADGIATFCWNVSLWQMLLPLWQME